MLSSERENCIIAGIELVMKWWVLKMSGNCCSTLPPSPHPRFLLRGSEEMFDSDAETAGAISGSHAVMQSWGLQHTSAA